MRLRGVATLGPFIVGSLSPKKRDHEAPGRTRATISDAILHGHEHRKCRISRKEINSLTRHMSRNKFDLYLVSNACKREERSKSNGMAR